MVNNWGNYKWSKEKMQEYDTRRRLEDPVGSLLRGAKKRAKIKGIEFDISKEDLGLFPVVCPVLGVELQYSQIGRQQPNSASLDRFDNSKGYIKGNVRIISLRANELKRDGTLEEFLHIVRYLQTND
jgi:hypothetical protein